MRRQTTGPYGRAILTVAALLAGLTGAAEARGDDCSFGGSAGAVVPLAETRVRMLEERIVMTLGERWSVVATYRFRNPTGRTITLQMGFPERNCAHAGSCTDSRFHGLETTVRGRAATHRVGRVSPEEHEWAERIDRVHLYDVTFRPRETVEIVHRYEHERSRCAGGASLFVEFITVTGRLWAGPIGRARFVVRVPRRPMELTFPAEYRLASYSERMVDGEATTEVVFTTRRWTPEVDFNLGMEYRPEHRGGDGPVYTSCPGLGAFSVDLDDPYFAGMEPSERLEAIGPLPGADDLASLTEDELQICRNLPFALHGRPFRSARLRRAFYAPQPPSDDPMRYVGLRPNPRYADGLLRPIDLAYARAVDAEIERRAAARSSGEESEREDLLEALRQLEAETRRAARRPGR